MGNVAILKRPLLAVIVVALAASVISMPVRASAGAGGPLDQMEAVVDAMESSVESILDTLQQQLEEAETEAAQQAAYVAATNAIQAKRQQKLAALAEIAGNSPALKAAMVPFQIEINELADEALEVAGELLEGADLPELPTTTTSIPLPTTTTTITVPRSTTTTVHSSTTTTTRPRNSTTTTQPAATTTTVPPSPPTTQPPSAPASTVPPTTLPAAPTASIPDESTGTTTTVPGLLAGAGADDGSGGGSSLSDLGVRVEGDQSGVLESDLSSLRSLNETPNLEMLTSFEIQPGLMDGTGLLVEYVGSSLPGPVAAPVISIVAILEMVMRALLSGTQAFVGPALVFGLYSAYRSLVVLVARRRQSAISV